MVRPDFEKWGQSPKEILKLSLEAEHQRTRERFQALYIIGTEQANATQWAQVIGRQNVTIINWVHSYNAQGPAGIVYRPSGGHPPFSLKEREEIIQCDGDNTIRFLKRLLQSLDGSQRQLVIIWDGAPWHRSQKVLAAAHQLGIDIVQLPGYSPDLNPIEALWKWMREEVSQHHGHATLRDLFLDCLAFIDRINLEPEQIIARLWPKFDLDPNYEKLLVSNY